MSDKTPARTKPETISQPISPPTSPGQTIQETGIKGPEQMPGEIGGPKGPEPTRYGDWEFKGRCSDF